jgi:integrase/recombinase XerD
MKGSIKRTTTGSWRARLRIAGKPVSKSLPTRAEAVAWLKIQRDRKLRVECGLSDPVIPQMLAVTFGEVVAPYLEHLETVGSLGKRRRPMTPESLRSATTETTKVIGWWDAFEVAATTQDMLIAYERHLRVNEGLTTSTIRHRLTRVSQLMRFALMRGWIEELPCEVTLPRLTLASTPKIANRADVEMVLPSCGRRLATAILLAMDAGLRRSEIFRLTLADVTVSARASEGKLEYGWIDVRVDSEDERTKSGRGRRVPILTGRLSSALLSAGAHWSADTRVCSFSSVGSMSAYAGCSNIRFHELRRLFATEALERGENIERVRQWMGHAELTTTQKYLRVGIEPSVAAEESR